MLDDHLFRRHVQRPFGEVDRHDHRQHLRREADGHRKAEKERFEPVALAETDDQEHRRHHHHHEADHQHGEGVDALVEAGLLALLVQPLGNGAEKGAPAGIDHHRARRAAADAAALKAGVAQFENGGSASVASLRALFNRHGFAGEGCLADEEVLRGDEPQVGGNHRSGLKLHDVARHQLRERHLDLHAVANDVRARLNALAERLDRIAGAPVEHVGDADAEDDHD